MSLSIGEEMDEAVGLQGEEVCRQKKSLGSGAQEGLIQHSIKGEL